MGDLIQFRTASGNLNLIFYRITSGGISFSVKSENSATIGLVSSTDRDFIYKVLIEPYKCSLFAAYEDEITKTTSENLLSGDEFKQFWILWRDKEIAFGTGCTVLLRYKSNENIMRPQPNYVAFYTSDGSDHSSQWQFYASPIVDDLLLKTMTGGEPHWVQVEDQLPDGALIGGYENEYLYIMRARWRGSLTPGKFVPSLGVGFISWGGNSHECETVEILSGYNCAWVESQDNRVPLDAVEGGYSEVEQEILYVGRVYHEGHLIVGKVQPSHCCCYFPYKNQELPAKTFEVLVVPHRRKHGIIGPIDM